MKIQILNRFTTTIIFEHDSCGNTILITLLLAIKSGADLRGADLRGAKLTDKDIISKIERPIIQITNIGSRNDTLIAFHTNNGIRLKTGCFYGSIEQFTNQVSQTHKGNIHFAEYDCALTLIKLHMKLWSKMNS